jgi:hypothetical protein
MKNNIYNNNLYTFFCANNSINIKRILELFNGNEIDVLYENGMFFKTAISNNNSEICQALLSFFETKQNPSEEQKEQLKDILEEITSFSTISKEMQLVLKNYIPYEENYIEEAFFDCSQGYSGQVYYEAPEENHKPVNLSGETLE